MTADPGGNVLSSMRYTAFGEMRSASGSTSTDYRYTGQREEAELGLYYYVARWYDPSLGRFIQADSMVPNPGNPMDWDRYAYVRNNPVNSNDPDGHTPLLVTALIGAGIGAMVDYAYQVADNVISGQEFYQAVTNVDSAEIVGAAVAGGIAGLTLGLGNAALAAVGGVAATTEIIAVPVAAVAGGVGNGLGGQVGALAEAGVRQIGNSQFDKNEFYADAFDSGFLNADEFMWDIGTGAILGAGGQAVSNLTAPSTAAKYQFYNQIKDLEGNVIQIPQFTPARLPGEQIKPIIKGPAAGLMRKTSDLTHEIITQGFDRYRIRAR